MKNKALLLFVFCLLSFFRPGLAQSDLSEMTYKAYITEDKDLWKEVVKKRQNLYEKEQSGKNLYQLAMAQYGLLNNTRVDKDEDLFDEYYDEILENIDKLIETEHEKANAYALRAAVYGLETSYSGWKGMFLGPKSSSNLSDAKEEDDSSAFVWATYGSAKLFAPSMFGGDKDEAIKSFKKAIELYEKANLQQDWRYLYALAWLGQAYYRTDQPQKAKEIYNKALKIEPNFKWVKDDLLPQVN
ncbi:tetratricopeptide repeat protein [Fulvivirga sediminis]|uniref:Tetratricopeptide repeat protein n=1 Tax=Fulvivirga sediminis TaxID=2803949 RepID=A0A937F8C5_9BACT|nr:tetratricopeptide repeat protein [Fulvivirga sediminis]MBL3656149.1 tetratricopeptide repeat protein [Fulvivirga sediminis]